MPCSASQDRLTQEVTMTLPRFNPQLQFVFVTLPLRTQSQCVPVLNVWRVISGNCRALTLRI